MAVLLSSLIQDVKSRLGETNSTRAAQLDSGVDTTPLVTSDGTITNYLNEAAADVARWTWPITGSATVTLSIGSAGVPYSTLIDSIGRQVHLAQTVVAGGTLLVEAAEQILRRWLGADFQSVGAPLYWYDSGVGIGLDTEVVSSTSLTATGFVLPRPMAESSDAVDGLPDDLAKLLVFYAAAMVAAKNAEDPSLGPRVAEWMAAYTNGCLQARGRVMARDPEMAMAYFAVGGAVGGKI